MSCDRSDGKLQVGCNHPTYTTEVGCRFGAAIALYETRKMAADKLGISTDQLLRYIKGKVPPPFDVLMSLSSQKGISLNWLATGVGKMLLDDPDLPEVSTPENLRLDEDLHGLIIEGISIVYKEIGARISPRDLGRLAARIHADLIAACDDPNDRPGGLKMALQQLRRTLAAPPSSNIQTKHSA